MKSRQEIQQHLRRCEDHFSRIYFLHGRDDPKRFSKFPTEFHQGVDLWLAGVEGLQRTLEWSLGRCIYYEAFYLLTREYLNKMRLNYWVEHWAYLPSGEPLPFEHQQVPTHHPYTADQVGMVLARAVAVQNRVLSIDKFHPGSWHPMFHTRVKKWLVNVENIIRAAEWILDKRSTENALYMIEPRSLEQLDQALRGGILPYSSGAIQQVDSLLGFEVGQQDHKPEDFV